jgi:hypothetical protein
VSSLPKVYRAGRFVVFDNRVGMLLENLEGFFRKDETLYVTVVVSPDFVVAKGFTTTTLEFADPHGRLFGCLAKIVGEQEEMFSLHHGCEHDED